MNSSLLPQYLEYLRLGHMAEHYESLAREAGEKGWSLVDYLQRGRFLRQAFKLLSSEAPQRLHPNAIVYSNDFNALICRTSNLKLSLFS